ncbi:HAD family acid phosphatase [Bradyrhizobium liaoningense]|uniref:HAD family acid phosphatase n=1 Tax=Bradyrhizobium liaoningense TaxID=43992 RepID=UPI001BAE3E1D|nr:HAD family acid phosphatase [Bradyrhizobium liaoningense]MBR1029386.1 HAD family acid phosphatase [Bradyrhizobium liaoningense]
MHDFDVNTAQRNHAGWYSSRRRAALAVMALVAALVASEPAAVRADDCPAPREPRIPVSEQPVLNIDKHKKQLLAYQAGNYADDIALVIADARAYVERRADQVKMPAVVLDIDETLLSNWENVRENIFGFIKGGPCTQQPTVACGFDEWIHMAVAPAIEPTRTFFNAMRARNISIFFITGRRNSQRDATLINLDHAGFEGWAKLVTRPDGDGGSIVPFKSGERARIAAAGYTIIATIGDQQSDIDGGFAECGFKLPNPFYFID